MFIYYFYFFCKIIFLSLRLMGELKSGVVEKGWGMGRFICGCKYVDIYFHLKSRLHLKSRYDFCYSMIESSMWNFCGEISRQIVWMKNDCF